MRILVTGAAGFIGSHLCERLIADGHDVVGLDAFIPYYPRAIKECNLAAPMRHERFELVELDLRYGNLAPYVDAADAIVHQAAMAGPASWDLFDLYASCNLNGTQRLLEAVRLAGRERAPRFVQISTSSVYGVNALGDENSPLRPASPYGITKLAAEQLALAYGRSFDIPVVALRYFSIYGPRQRPDMAYHIFINQLLRGEPITIFGDGEQTRGNTYIDDCIEGTVRALHCAPAGQAYNLGGGTPISLNHAIDILEAAIGQRARRNYVDARIGDQRHTLADYSKAEAAFGYAPQTQPETGLLAQLEWQRCHVKREPNCRDAEALTTRLALPRAR